MAFIMKGKGSRGNVSWDEEAREVDIWDPLKVRIWVIRAEVAVLHGKQYGVRLLPRGRIDVGGEWFEFPPEKGGRG